MDVLCAHFHSCFISCSLVSHECFR